MRFHVEVEDPHAADDRNDERFECETAAAAAMRFDEYARDGHPASNALSLVRGDELEFVHPESGVTVTARRVPA